MEVAQDTRDAFCESDVECRVKREDVREAAAAKETGVCCISVHEGDLLPLGREGLTVPKISWLTAKREVMSSMLDDRG